MDPNYFPYKSNNISVIYQKSFKAPITPYYKSLLQRDNDEPFNFDIKANLEFYLRFYFPKNQITIPKAKTNRLIIMLNGLNEIYSCFHDDTSNIKSCALLNSGATLNEMKLKGILDDELWKGVVREIEDPKNSKDDPYQISFTFLFIPIFTRCIIIININKIYKN